jgi:hypothetical protein
MKLKDFYSVYKIPPLAYIGIEINTAHKHIYSLKFHANIILPFTPVSLEWSLTFRFFIELYL